MSRPAPDWATLTRSQAARLRVGARRHEQSQGARFERGEISEAEFLAAVQAEEDLHVFALTGLAPHEVPA